MNLAVVVQRYGADINGGAELHARYIAERLARHASVEVITTCARDYVTWRNERPVGVEPVNGIPVRRFPVAHERDPDDFGRRSHRVFEQTHSIADELRWLESEGPASSELVNYVAASADRFDFILLFSYRYYHAWHLARRVAAKAVLVPTAERDPAVAVSIFGPVFRGVRGLMSAPRGIVAGRGAAQLGAGGSMGIAAPVDRIELSRTPAQMRYLSGLLLQSIWVKTMNRSG